jgi:hypothetical protein
MKGFGKLVDATRIEAVAKWRKNQLDLARSLDLLRRIAMDLLNAKHASLRACTESWRHRIKREASLQMIKIQESFQRDQAAAKASMDAISRNNLDRAERLITNRKEREANRKGKEDVAFAVAEWRVNCLLKSRSLLKTAGERVAHLEAEAEDGGGLGGPPGPEGETSADRKLRCVRLKALELYNTYITL